ncbi:hypothetical protein CUMW_038690 [Citrus unshiu]|nr:hypothetical protein CUMW_038690 [Citrus unshiu]
MLPREYCEEIRDRGFLVSWSPQEQVLCHPSDVAFLTHSRWNWNSTIESLFSMSSRGTGMEINQNVKRDEVKVLVRGMMEGDKGKPIKCMALGWKKKAEAATYIGDHLTRI